MTEANAVMLRMLSEVNRPRDLALDPYVRLTETDLDRLLAEVGSEIASVRSRAPTASQAKLEKKLLGLVAANAFRADIMGRRCHYGRGRSEYPDGPQGPSWLRAESLISFVDRAEAAGLLEVTTGDRGPKSTQPKARSTFAPSGMLRSAFSIACIDSRGLDFCLQERPALEVRDSIRNLIVVDPSDEFANQIAGRVRSYNAFIRPVNLALDGVTLPFMPLYRVFNGPRLDLGGRFYGGVVQSLPKADRARLTIDGEPVSELDFSGFMVRALYHMDGLELDGDPYEIPELVKIGEALGLQHNEIRNEIKLMCLFALNAKSQNNLPLSNDGLKSFGRRKANYGAILNHHASIKSHFFSQPALMLMNKESRICSTILQRATIRGTPVYQIHDSFLTAEKEAHWLRQIMISEYKHIFGHDPIVH